MTSELLFDPVSINLDTVKLGSVKGKWKKNDVKVFSDKKEVQFKTCIMETKYGVQMNSYKKDEHYVDLTTTDSSFIKAITDFDDHLVEQISNSPGLFETNVGLTQIKNSFMGIAKSRSPFNIRLILPKNDLGNFDWALFDSNKKEIKVTPENVSNFIPKNTMCKVIFTLDRVWYFNERFGIICKLKQMKLEPKVPSADDKGVEQGNVGPQTDYLFLD